MNDLTKNELCELEDDWCREKLSFFIKKVFNTVDPGATFLHNWHIDLMAEYLEAVTRGEIKRLLINIPPGYLKSITVNIAWPAWELGHSPSQRFYSTSYSSDLAIKHNVACRDVLKTLWYQKLFPETTLRRDIDMKALFATTKGGFKEAVSLSGSTTGSGGNRLIVDDPHNTKTAESSKQRQQAIYDFDRGFTSRLRDKKNGTIVVVMQRLHQLDLSGHILDQGHYEHVCVPAEAPEYKKIYLPSRKPLIWNGAALVRKKGDILHPAREDTKELERTKIELGPYAYAGQYQQTPVPLGGGMFKREWMEYYDNTDGIGMNKIILVDPAESMEPGADYTSMWVIGLARDGNYYVIDFLRDRLNITMRMDKLFQLHEDYRPVFVGYETFGTFIGDIVSIKEKMKRDNYRFKIVGLHDGTSRTAAKLCRIERLVPDFAAGRIIFPETLMYKTMDGQVIDMVKTFLEDEFLTYPVCRHEDMIDGLSLLKDPDMKAKFPVRANVAENSGYDTRKTISKPKQGGWMSV